MHTTYDRTYKDRHIINGIPNRQCIQCEGPQCFKINIRISVTWACVFVRADIAIIRLL